MTIPKLKAPDTRDIIKTLKIKHECMCGVNARKTQLRLC